MNKDVAIKQEELIKRGQLEGIVETTLSLVNGTISQVINAIGAVAHMTLPASRCAEDWTWTDMETVEFMGALADLNESLVATSTKLENLLRGFNEEGGDEHQY